MLIAPDPHERVKRLLLHVVVASLPINETPTFQTIQPSYDRRARHAHIGGNFGNREWLFLEFTKRDAQADEESFETAAERFTGGSVSSVQASHDIDHQATEHQPLAPRSDPVQSVLRHKAHHFAVWV